MKRQCPSNCISDIAHMRLIITEVHISAHPFTVVSYMKVTVQGHGKVASIPAWKKKKHGVVLRPFRNFSYWPWIVVKIHFYFSPSPWYESSWDLLAAVWATGPSPCLARPGPARPRVTNRVKANVAGSKISSETNTPHGLCPDTCLPPPLYPFKIWFPLSFSARGVQA